MEGHNHHHRRHSSGKKTKKKQELNWYERHLMGIQAKMYNSLSLLPEPVANQGNGLHLHLQWSAMIQAFSWTKVQYNEALGKSSARVEELCFFYNNGDYQYIYNIMLLFFQLLKQVV